MKIGITGTIASGKTTVSFLIKKRGFPVFNADQYSSMCLHNTHPACAEIQNVYPQVMADNGDVDKKKLGALIFSDEEARQKINHIVHPYVIEGMRNFFTKQRNIPMVFAEVPLLFEAGLEDEFDKILVVTCREEVAIQRMMEDREYTEEQARARLASQIHAQEQIEKADYVLYNDTDIKSLNAEVNRLFKEWRKETRKAC